MSCSPETRATPEQVAGQCIYDHVIYDPFLLWHGEFMNYRNGFIRLALVTVLPWSLYWGYEFADGHRQAEAARLRYTRLEHRIPKQFAYGSKDWGVAYQSNGAAAAFDEWGAQSLRMEQAARTGLGLPAGGLALSLLILFVYRGFRSVRRTSATTST